MFTTAGPTLRTARTTGLSRSLFRAWPEGVNCQPEKQKCSQRKKNARCLFLERHKIVVHMTPNVNSVAVWIEIRAHFDCQNINIAR